MSASRSSMSTSITATARRASSTSAPTSSRSRSTPIRPPTIPTSGAMRMSAAPARVSAPTSTCRCRSAPATTATSRRSRRPTKPSAPSLPARSSIALGLDASEHDPLAGLAVTTPGFRRIGAAIAKMGLPTVLVQEGGYLSDILGANLAAVLARIRGGALRRKWLIRWPFNEALVMPNVRKPALPNRQSSGLTSLAVTPADVIAAAATIRGSVVLSLNATKAGRSPRSAAATSGSNSRTCSSPPASRSAVR